MRWTDKHESLWRAPDKPIRATLGNLPILERRGGYVAQPKIDGHRAAVEIDDHEIRVISRQDNPLPVSVAVKEQVRSLNLPAGTMLDCEWAGRRAKAAEGLWILGLLFWEWIWVGPQSLTERLKPLEVLTDLPPLINRVASHTEGFLPLLLDQIGDPLSEGIVLKRIATPLVGKRSGSAKNPGWYKVKWRDGPSGEDIVLTRERVKELM